MPWAMYAKHAMHTIIRHKSTNPKCMSRKFISKLIDYINYIGSVGMNIPKIISLYWWTYSEFQGVHLSQSWSSFGPDCDPQPISDVHSPKAITWWLIQPHPTVWRDFKPKAAVNQFDHVSTWIMQLPKVFQHLVHPSLPLVSFTYHDNTITSTHLPSCSKIVANRLLSSPNTRLLHFVWIVGSQLEDFRCYRAQIVNSVFWVYSLES